MIQEIPPDWSWNLCPAPPAWNLSWERLRELPGMESLAGCPQDPRHHAEGDVLTHTKLVCERLVEAQAWRALAPGPRATVFLATLLHDIGKPGCTRKEAGRITSPNHGRAGASLVRQLFWHGDGGGWPLAPMAVREVAASLVRLSSLPLWLLDKADPERSVIAASQRIPCQWLALMSEADVRGRSCNDQQELLERISLFRDYCGERECFETPFRFASDHSRFAYFQGLSTDPRRKVFDDSRAVVTLMSGLPGAGKDSWVAGHAPGLPVVSPDHIRKELGADPAGPQGKVAAAARERAQEHLRARRPFVWNATNTTRLARRGLIRLLTAYKARIRIVYVEPPTYEELLRRNKARRMPVPRVVIDKLIERLDIPDVTEAHRVEWITTSASPR